jgi:hypothetical protein
MISYFSSPFMLLNKYFCESVLLPEVTKYLFMFFFSVFVGSVPMELYAGLYASIILFGYRILEPLC